MSEPMTAGDRYLLSNLAQLDDVTKERIDYVKAVLGMAHVQGILFNPSKIRPRTSDQQLIVAVFYAIPDSLLDNKVRAEVVAKMDKRVRDKLGIKKSGQQSLERVEEFLRKEEGKRWLKAWFASFRMPSGQVAISKVELIATVERKALDLAQDIPSGPQDNTLGNPGSNGAGNVVAVDPTAATTLPVQARAPTPTVPLHVPPTPSGHLSTGIPHTHPGSSHRRNGSGSAAQSLMSGLICPNCHGRICGRGLTVCQSGSISTSRGSAPAAGGNAAPLEREIPGTLLQRPSWNTAFISMFVLVVLLGTCIRMLDAVATKQTSN